MAIAFGAEAVFQDEGDDAPFIQPAGVTIAFMGGKGTISAAGENDDSGSVGFAGGPEDKE